MIEIKIHINCKLTINSKNSIDDIIKQLIPVFLAVYSKEMKKSKFTNQAKELIDNQIKRILLETLIRNSSNDKPKNNLLDTTPVNIINNKDLNRWKM